MENLLQVKALTKTYQMGEVKVHALRGVDLDLTSGEMIVLLGHSGSGKSTLLNIMGGLDTPSEGQVNFKGENLNNYSNKQLTLFRRENIGFIFQMYNLIPRLTAYENVELITDICDNPMDPLEALTLVGLKDRAHHFPSQLSGGEQQRVAIARAIAKQPQLLFCDEPTGALDLHTGILVLEAIKTVNEKLGTTTVIITHNVSIANMADRVITLADGQIKEIKTNTHKIQPKDLKW